ncbi:major facilitator superfamily domain-containing protein [Blyttiomyces helicus]|uniref:Major facilitator superfamily domain-containing protein n=1 Tax=Blyttiomyces helicus TaxID=388810 RepID=A0A4P9WD57_9FUNG|nr:major facilitator superfamily domain-containing protein [Blyttiomyces helicus]|eukprot:RKO88870.1 major facilitator superfamily domain-containing protein [Blyttiomyces helicus]
MSTSGTQDAIVQAQHPTYDSIPTTPPAPEKGEENTSLIYRWRVSQGAVIAVVALALFTDMVVYGAVIPVLPKLVTERLHLDRKFIGILLACYAAGLLLVTPVIGVLSDIYSNRKIPMLIGLGGLMMTTLLFAYGDTFWTLVMARMGQGISGGISWTIGFCMLADIFPASELGGVMGQALSANTLGFLVGPPLGGILFDWYGFTAPFLFCSALALIDLAGRLFIRPKVTSINYDAPEDTEERSPLISDHTRSASPSSSSRTNMIELLCDPQVLCTCTTIVLGATAFSGIEPTLPIYLEEVFGASPSTVGLLWIAIIVPNAVVGIYAGHASDKHGRKVVSAIGLLLFGLATPLLAYADNIILLVIALALFGATNAAVMTPALPEMAEFVHTRGGGAFAQAYALFNMSYSCGMLVGPIVGSFLVEMYGFKAQMLFFGAILVLFAPVVWWASRVQRNGVVA